MKRLLATALLWTMFASPAFAFGFHHHHHSHLKNHLLKQHHVARHHIKKHHVKKPHTNLHKSQHKHHA